MENKKINQGSAVQGVTIRRRRCERGRSHGFLQRHIRPDESTGERNQVVEAINRSVSELYQGLETHRCLMASILEKNLDKKSVDSLLSFCPSRGRENRLRDAIKEAIDVLEESRKAFKSKRLEQLRKNLTQVLIDSE